MKLQMAALTAILTLAACGETAQTAEPMQDTEVADVAQAITVSNARMVLPPVKGNPAAVYFDLTYGGEAAVTLDSASVEGSASSMIHQTSDDGHMVSAEAIKLIPGETLSFAPGGLHIMAMQVAPEIEAGSKTSVTVTLSDGTTTSFQADVRGAGDER